MKRRQFLATAGLGAVATTLPLDAGATGFESPTPMQMEVFLHDLRRSLDAITEKVVTAFADVPRMGPKRLLTARALRAMHAYAAVGRLPIRAQAYPGVQQLIGEIGTGVHATLLELRDTLSNRSPEEREAGARIREEPGLVDDWSAWFRSEGAVAGVDGLDARRLDRQLDEVAFKLRHRPADDLVDDLVRQVDRLEARARRQEASRADPALEAEVDDAVAHWNRHGVVSPRDRTSDGGAVAGGIILVVLGLLFIILGIAIIACWCISIPLILLGLVLLVLGFMLISKSSEHG